MVHPPIPRLEDYSISATTGFLPDVPPLTALQDPYYGPWEAIISNLQALILSKKIRQEINRLPVLTTIRLENEAEWRRAYVILSFLSHSYIWGDKTPAEVGRHSVCTPLESITTDSIVRQTLPQAISIPYLAVSAKLEVPPVATYASLCLWNFRPIFQDDVFDDLSNIATLHTFTGALDESWFYLVSIAIEARGAAILPTMLDAIENAREGNIDQVVPSLQSFAERLGELTHLLSRMYENCDPHIFYTRIRPYLAGSKNMSQAGLPRGVKYLDGSGHEPFRHYSGGSNAQSSLIQAFDILLGVEHRPTGDRKFGPQSANIPSDSQAKSHNFILEMREYMPGPHRRFLEHLAKVSNIREFVEHHSSHGALTVAYDACLHMLRGFRDKHIQIVSRYIVLPAKEQRIVSGTAVPKIKSTSPPPIRMALQPPQTQSQGLVRTPKQQSDLRGTGGTALIPFLKQARDETGEPSISAWARRLLTNSRSSFSIRDTETVRIQGLAGQWLDSEDVGGICHW
ncbi:Myoglobin [Orbilia brochopaga]|nr:Myoglobin [Drechslerella brochopaga]